MRLAATAFLLAFSLPALAQQPVS
ncbi:MAG: hypothetical protein JWR00_700, partial [Rubritepida sp.]|nr:hypothetical protein [Rubritepida sp.]